MAVRIDDVENAPRSHFRHGLLGSSMIRGRWKQSVLDLSEIYRRLVQQVALQGIQPGLIEGMHGIIFWNNPNAYI